MKCPLEAAVAPPPCQPCRPLIAQSPVLSCTSELRVRQQGQPLRYLRGPAGTGLGVAHTAPVTRSRTAPCPRPARSTRILCPFETSRPSTPTPPWALLGLTRSTRHPCPTVNTGAQAGPAACTRIFGWVLQSALHGDVARLPKRLHDQPKRCIHVAHVASPPPPHAPPLQPAAASCSTPWPCRRGPPSPSTSLSSPRPAACATWPTQW